MTVTNAEVLRGLIAQAGTRAPAAGPYHGSAQAWRELILGAIPIVRSDGVLLEWDTYDSGAGADVYAPVADTQQADGRYLGLRGDVEAAWGAAVGVPYSHDAVSGGAYGTIRDLGILPVPSGQRDSGYSRVLGVAVSGAFLPGVETDLWQNDDAYTIAARISTRGEGAQFIQRIDSVPGWDERLTEGDAAGVLLRSNENTIQIQIVNDTGALERRAVAGLTAGADYIAIGGYERTTPGGTEITLKLRVYEVDGTYINGQSFVRSGYGFAEMTEVPTVVHDAGWVRVYRTLLSDAEMDDVADGTDPTAGGTLVRHMTGIRTGIVDPGDATRLIVRAVSGTGAKKQARRPVPL